MAEEHHHHHHHKECGGLGEEKQATDKTQNIVDQVSGDVKANSDGRDYSNLKAVSFKKQVVNGFNHFIKVLTGAGNHIHLRVHEPINGQPELHGIQHDKKVDDEIHNFETNVKK